MNTSFMAACLLVVTFPVLAGEPLTTKADNPEGLSLLALPVGTILTSKSNGEPQVELSPDQKLARAYALCLRYMNWEESGNPAVEAWPEHCPNVVLAWTHQPLPIETDRAFIEEVARGLKEQK